jgi:1,4-alpha-glucan branching enzyme
MVQNKAVEIPFRFRSKAAREVRITGDFTNWTPEGIPLRKAPNGEWRTILGLTPGEYQYRLIIDGEWSDDPEATLRVPNVYGGENCVLQVAAEHR